VLCCGILSFLLIVAPRGPHVDKEGHPPAESIYFVTASNLHLRSKPSTTSESIGILKNSELVTEISRTSRKETINGIRGEWIEVRETRAAFDSSTAAFRGFVFDGYVRKAQIVKQPNAWDLLSPRGFSVSCAGDYAGCARSHSAVFALEEKRLVINLKNGRHKYFPIGHHSDGRVHSATILSFDESKGYLHLWAGSFDGEGDWLIHLADGKALPLVEFPVVSPDKNRFLAACASPPACRPGLQIVNISGANPIVEFKTTSEQWKYRAIWNDDKTVSIWEYFLLPDSAGFVERQRTLRYQKEMWSEGD